MPVHAFCSPQKGSRFTLGRSPGLEGAAWHAAGRFTFPSDNAEWHSKRRALTDSGGTAPDLHRTSLLCPPWAPEAFTVISFPVRAGQGVNPQCRLVDTLTAGFSEAARDPNELEMLTTAPSMKDNTGTHRLCAAVARGHQGC